MDSKESKTHLPHSSLGCGCWAGAPDGARRGRRAGTRLGTCASFPLPHVSDSQVTWGKANLINRWEMLSHY